MKNAFLNSTVLKKDILRFSPVWILFWVCLVISGQTVELMQMGATMSTGIMVYAFVCACALFADLYSPRRCNALHALPLRRECWFFTHCTAGLLFFIVPVLGFCAGYGGYAALQGGNAWDVLCTNFAVAGLQYLLFFGIAVLCVMLAGNYIGAALMYVVMNYLSPVLKWLFTSLIEPLLYGICVNTALFDWFSPVEKLEYYAYDYTLSDIYQPPKANWYATGNWGYALICAGVGIAACMLALQLYRRRKLETAADLLSVRWLGPAFVCVLSLMAGVAFFRLVGHSTDEYFMLVPYIALGFFAGRMLLKRRVNVFGLKDFLQLGLVLFILTDTLLLAHWASYGVVKRIPDADDVSSVGVYFTDGKSNYRYEDSLREDYTATSAESIGAIIRTHEALVQLKEYPQDQSLVYLTYHMKNGTTVRRYYPIDLDTAQGQALTSSLGTRDSIFNSGYWNTYIQQVYYIRVICLDGSGEIWFCDESTAADAAPNDTKVLRQDMMTKFLDKLNKDYKNSALKLEAADLTNIYAPTFQVFLYSRSSDGTERTEEFILIPSNSFHARPYLSYLYAVGTECPNRTITQETYPFD